jgi:hypothetical protein
MLVWIRIATNEAPTFRGKEVMPAASAAVVGSNVLLRFYHGTPSVSTVSVPFDSAAEASAWIEQHRAPVG